MLLKTWQSCGLFFSAKQWPKKFMRSDDFYFFGNCEKFAISIFDENVKLVVKFDIMGVL